MGEECRRTKQQMLLNPPFCRGAELEDVISAIRSEGSRAIFITSENGLGASTILRELTTVAQVHVPVLNIHSSQSLAKIPFGVLAPFLTAAGTRGASLRLAVLRGVLTELRQKQDLLSRGEMNGFGTVKGSLMPVALPTDPVFDNTSHELPIIVIDDAHLMDPATAELIVSLVRSGTVNLVASYSSRHVLPEPMPKLWADGLAEDIVLQPLDREQAHEFCENLLSGPVLQATGWHFWSSSGGNPLFLHLLVVQALEAGVLARRRGIWTVDPNTPIRSTGLEEAVLLELRGISRPASEALNLIALSQPVEFSVVEALTGKAQIQELLDSSLIRFVRPPTALLALANPIFGDVVRELVPLSQSRVLHERLIRQIQDNPVDKEALLRRVVWAVEVGIEVPADRLLTAAVLASKLFQSHTALELANQIRGEDHRLRANMVKARAYYNLGDYQSALSQTQTAFQRGGSLGELLFGSLLRASTRAALGMPVELLVADANALRNRGTALAQKNAADSETIMALSESGALLIELLALSRKGRYSDMTEPMTWLTESHGISPEVVKLNRTMVLTMESERLSAQGFPVQGMAKAAEAFAIEHAEESDVFFLPESILLRHLAAAMCCGDWSAATKVLEEFSLEAGPVVFSFGGGANVVRGMAFLRSGRISDALEVLLTGIDALQQSDPQQLLGFCTAMAAYAAAKMRNLTLAQQLMDSYVEGRCLFLVVSHERAYLAAAKYLLKHDAGAPVELLALADGALVDRSSTLELNALALILELGDVSVAPRLERVAAGVEGQWARAMCTYARALQDMDGQQLALSGEVLSTAGLFGFAKQALELSVKRLVEGGFRAQIRSVKSRLLQVEENLGQQGPERAQPDTSADSLQESPAQLTRREKEISRLAAQGLTDREIAEELVLSLRTVEGHLYRVYAKLNISSREELPDLIK